MWQGQSFSELSRYSEAIESYTLVPDLKPDYVDAYHELGWCHVELGHYAEAAAAHEHEIKLRISNNSGADEKGQTKLSRAYEELGITYFFDLRLPEAERAFRQAIGLTPNSLQAHAGLVAVYQQMGNDSEAEKEQRLVLELEGAPSPASEQN
jgi:tetratricopeptide (TPR) repeat protein